MICYNINAPLTLIRSIMSTEFTAAQAAHAKARDARAAKAARYNRIDRAQAKRAQAERIIKARALSRALAYADVANLS